METRGYKRKYLENVVEERLKKIRSELFIINTSTDSEDERNQEVDEDHDMIESHVHDDDKDDDKDDDNAIHELDNDSDENDIHNMDEDKRDNTKHNEDADKSFGKHETDENNGEGICFMQNVAIKEEPVEELIVQRQVAAPGEHMYCPIVISDSDFDYNIDEDGIEFVHVPQQSPEVVNLDSSDDEMSIIGVDNGSVNEMTNQQSDPENNLYVENEIVDKLSHDLGENVSSSDEAFQSEEIMPPHHQTTKKDKDDQQCTALTNSKFSDKESVYRMKNNSENTYKELTIPKALSVLGCEHYMQDLDQQREEDSRPVVPGYTENVKKLPPSHYLGIVNYKTDSNKIAYSLDGENQLDVQEEANLDKIDQMNVSNRLDISSPDKSFLDKGYDKTDGKPEDHSDCELSTHIHNVDDEGQSLCENALTDDKQEKGNREKDKNEDDKSDNSVFPLNGEDNQDFNWYDLNEDYKGEDKSENAMNEEKKLEKHVCKSDKTELRPESNNREHDAQQMDCSTKSGMDSVSFILSKAEGETFKYQDETFIVLSSSESDVEELNKDICKNKVRKMHKHHKLHDPYENQLSKINSANNDQDDDNVSDKLCYQSDSSCTSSEATINDSMVEVDEETCSEYDTDEAKEVNYVKLSDKEDKISSSIALDKVEIEVIIERSFEKLTEHDKENVLHVKSIDESGDNASINRKTNEGISNSAKNSENIVHQVDEETTCSKEKDGIFKTSTKPSPENFLEVNGEIIELHPLGKVDDVFDSPFKKQNLSRKKDKSAVLKLPKVRNLRKDEKLRTKSSKCYSPIRYISEASPADEQVDYFRESAYQRYDAYETEEHWRYKDDWYNQRRNYTRNVDEEEKTQSVWKQLGLGTNHTLAITLHRDDSEIKENESKDDALFADITPVKRVVVIKPNLCEDEKAVENHDLENKKPIMGDYDHKKVPKEPSFPIPVAKTLRTSSVQQSDVKEVVPNLKGSLPSCIVPLKEVHLSETSNNSKSTKILKSGDESDGRKKLGNSPDRSQTSKLSDFAISFRNSDHLPEKLSNVEHSGTKFDYLSQGKIKQQDITYTESKSQRTSKAVRLGSIHNRQEPLREVDGELTPREMLLQFKCKANGYVRCDDCGHECLKREHMLRHFKYTMHQSASYNKWVVSGLFDRKEDFVVNIIRPFDNEFVHICPLSQCGRVFLSRAYCIAHYQTVHGKSDMLYCTATIQKEELCHIRCFCTMLECKICGNVFADGLNLEYHIQNSLHQLYHKYEGTFIIYVCYGCHRFFTNFVLAVDHKCCKKNSASIALRLLHVSKESKEMWVVKNKFKVSKVDRRNEIDP